MAELSQASILYDLPGPRAKRRNAILGVASTVGIIALIAFIGYKFADTGQFEARKWEQFQYASVQRELLAGLGATLKAAGIAAVLALIFGAFFASARLSDKWYLRSPATFVVELFRAIPLLILIFFGYYVPLQYGWSIDKLWALVIGLMLYNGSVLAEIFRAGINAVPYGQTEGAYAVGMRKNQVLRLILLPQACGRCSRRSSVSSSCCSRTPRWASSSRTPNCSSWVSRSAAGCRSGCRTCRRT